MNPTLNKIIENLIEYNNFFTKNEFYPIQKAYTTPHFLVLLVRVPGKTISLYFGRGNQYLGVYPFLKPPPSFLRIQDKFLDYVRSHLVGAKIGKIDLIKDEKGEYFQFRFKTNTDDNYFYISYCNREMFFARTEGTLTFCSWNNLIDQNQDVKWPLMEIEKHAKFIDVEKYLNSEELKSEGILEQKKREKFLSKKLENIQNDLANSEKWKEIELLLNNNQIDLTKSELKINNNSFKFIGLKTDWEKKDLIYKRIKKLKRGEMLLTERLKEVTEELSQTEKGKFVKKTTKEKAIQILWKSGIKNIKKDNSDSNEFQKIKIGNLHGLIGLNSSGNDSIRNLSSKEHYWFHIENYPGAHLILKTEETNQLTQDVLALIASILRDYSKLSILEIPIMFTQVKNIKGVKGVKGEVIAKKTKFINCPYRSWKEIISIV